MRAARLHADYDWTRRSGSIAGSKLQHRTEQYHTSGSSYYMYVEASSPNNPNKVFTLASPTFADSVSEVNFYYHMSARAWARAARRDDGPSVSWATIWTKSEVTGHIWQGAAVTIATTQRGPSAVGRDGIEFEGDMGRRVGIFSRDDIRTDSRIIRPSGGGGMSSSSSTRCCQRTGQLSEFKLTIKKA